MKKHLFTMLLLFLTNNIYAQEKTAIIEIKAKNDSYFIEVADRNCGATSNSQDDYGNYYMWNNIKKSAKRMKLNEIAAACDNFNAGGYSDWRVPNVAESTAITSRIECKNNYAILRCQTHPGNIIYFPYGGVIEPNKKTPIDKGVYGYFWTSKDVNSNKALVSEYCNVYINIRQIPKDHRVPVRCVRTIK